MIILSANKENFSSSFPIWMSFVYFCGLLAIAKTSGAEFNRSIDSRHLCLVLGHRGKAFSLSLLSMMLILSFFRYLL